MTFNVGDSVRFRDASCGRWQCGVVRAVENVAQLDRNGKRKAPARYLWVALPSTGAATVFQLVPQKACRPLR